MSLDYKLPIAYENFKMKQDSIIFILKFVESCSQLENWS